MRSVKLGKIMGIAVELHSTFVWLLVLLVVALAVFDPANLLAVLVLFFFLFVSVFMHELFHSLVAVSKGTKVEKIVLLPIGGVALSEEMPEKPMDELQLALAGPMFNFVVVAGILAVVYAFPVLPWPWHVMSAGATAEALEQAVMRYPLFGLFWVNLVLGAFNLFVPALPLDGGRVLRAALAMIVGFEKATHIATKVSQLLAIAMAIIGFFINWILLIIALFVYFGAVYENEAVVTRETLRGVSLHAIINRRPVTVDAGQSLQETFDEMARTNRLAVLVDMHGLYGFVDAGMLSSVGKESWHAVSAGSIAKPLPAADISESAAAIIAKMTGKRLPMLPVFEHGELLGIVEESEINKLYALTKILKKL